MVGNARPSDAAGALVGSVKWTFRRDDGQTARFTLLNIDSESADGCYTTPCIKNNFCALAYYAVENKPCYGSNDAAKAQHPEWRELRCCREQRNTAGYLRGFEVRNGTLGGQLQYSACCMPCNPGEVNIGCNAFEAGKCTACAAGTFNPSGSSDKTPGKCLPCPSCLPGFGRVGCGPSSGGRCVACSQNAYKVRGLDGHWSDKCLPCDGRCGGSKLLRCGGASAGSCDQCPKGTFFASPYCRGCSPCRSSIYTRVAGCGGDKDTTCTKCEPGTYEVRGRVTCQRCSSCAANLAPASNGALHASGPLTRVGCGAFAGGECVRMAAALGDVVGASGFKVTPLCDTSGALGQTAFCPGSRIRVRWAMQGQSEGIPDLATGSSDCSGIAGVSCLAGIWQATLWGRTLANPLGEELANLGNWSLSEQRLESAESEVLKVKSATMEPLPETLPGASGYFVRLSLENYGTSSSLYADTVDFQVADVAETVRDDVEKAAGDLLASSPDTTAVAARLRIACSNLGRGANIGGFAETAAHAACEKVKALQLGMAVGELGLMPLQLPPPSITHMSTAMLAAQPLTSARSSLATWDKLMDRADVEVPPASSWSIMSASGVIKTTKTNTSMDVLINLASSAAAATNATRRVWEADVEASTNQLARTLRDLKQLDGLLSDASGALGFNIVSMAQAATKFLWEYLSGGASSGGKTVTQWYSIALNMIGSVAVMLMGSWRGDWRHSIQWRIGAEVQRRGTATAQLQSIFGGVASASGAVPLVESRSRVWTPFREVADAWLTHLAADVNKRRLVTNASNSSTAPIAPGPKQTSTTSTTATLPPQSTSPIPQSTNKIAKLQAQGLVIDELVTCVESVTEHFFEPLSRAGSALLEGPLPDIAVCGKNGRLLQQFALGAAGAFNYAVDVVQLGLGAKAYRPWMDTTSETQRLRRASAEVVDLVYSRMKLFRTMFLQLLEVRDISAEVRRLHDDSANTHAAILHLSKLDPSRSLVNSAAVGPSRSQAVWRWSDTCLRIWRVLRHGRNSAALASRRSLGRFQRLVVWQGGALDSSGMQWPSAGRASQLQVVEMSTIRALSRALEAAAEAARHAGFLRIEGNAETWPLAFASLRESGTTVLNLHEPLSGPIRRHREVYAYLLSSDAEKLPYPLRTVTNPDKPAPKPSSDPYGINVPYVELELRQLMGGIGELPQSSAPMFTRHKRHECTALGLGMFPKVSAATEPLHGVWVLSARDGASRVKLQIDPGTSVRLYIKVDAPNGNPPWELLRGFKQPLYQKPNSSYCNALPAQWSGPVPIDTTAAPMVAAPKTSTSPRIAPVRMPDATTTFTLAPAFLMPGAAPAVVTTAPSTDFSIFTVVVPIMIAILLCACMFLSYNRYHDKFNAVLCSRIPFLRKFQKKQVTANDVPTSDSALDSASPKAHNRDGLRQRSPKGPPEGMPRLHGAAAVGPPSIPLGPPALGPPGMMRGNLDPKRLEYSSAQPQKQAVPQIEQSPAPVDVEDWGLGTDTPRRDDESSESGSSNDSSDLSSVDENGRPWRDVPPPSDSQRREESSFPLQPTGTVIGSADSGQGMVGLGPLSQHMQNSALFNPHLPVAQASPPAPPRNSSSPLGPPSPPPAQVAGTPSPEGKVGVPNQDGVSTNGGADGVSSHRTSPSSGHSSRQLLPLLGPPQGGAAPPPPPLGLPQGGATPPPPPRIPNNPFSAPPPPSRPPVSPPPSGAPRTGGDNGLRNAAAGDDMGCGQLLE